MAARLLALAAVAACYSPHAAPGAPCSPETALCPDEQSCAFVNGGYICIDGDGGSVGPTPGDAAQPSDATPLTDDAPRDAAPDAMVADWQLVQTAASESATTTLGTAIGKGHLIVVALQTDNTNTITSITDDAPGGSNTYVAVPNARATSATGTFGVELWYAADTRGGATVISVTATPLYSTVVWEVAGLRTMAPVDTAAVLDDQPAVTTVLGASLTTTAHGDFIVSAAIVQDAVGPLVQPTAFTNDHHTHANGWAHLTSPGAPPGTYQAMWTQGQAGAFCASSVAFLMP